MFSKNLVIARYNYIVCRGCLIPYFKITPPPLFFLVSSLPPNNISSLQVGTEKTEKVDSGKNHPAHHF